MAPPFVLREDLLGDYIPMSFSISSNSLPMLSM